MKIKIFFAVVLVACAFQFACPACAEENAPQNDQQLIDVKITDRPMIYMPETQYKFEPVLDGTQISHDFKIINVGGGVLNISDVITNCGCAKAEFPKQILPGDEGKITIKGDTTGYGGMSFDRDILVSTNDPAKSVFHIYYYGKVEEFAYIEPKVIVLRGEASQPLQSVVTVTPRKEYPFKLTDVSVDDAIKDKVKISTSEKDGKYYITVDNLQHDPGKFVGKLYLKTDSSLKPEIRMYIKGILS